MGAMGDNASPMSHLMRQADRQGVDAVFRNEKGSDTPHSGRAPGPFRG